MPQYIGFSTVNANKPKSTNVRPGIDGGAGSVAAPLNTGRKFRLVDSQLVVQDLINAFNIPQGSKVGQPGYGTTLWSFIFEPGTPDTQFKIEAEVRRIIELDPRIIVNTVKTYPEEHGILIEVELAVSPFNQATLLNLFFDNLSQQASVV
jgi:phage baseplate assembly protein W